MCPACLTTLVLAIGGTGSAGGLTAWVVSKLFRRNRPAQSAAQSEGAP
jgi:hypothetical protein